MPYSLCFALGFSVGAVSPAILVPSLLTLIQEGFGVKKGVPVILLAAASLDDIVAIIVFGVCTTLAFNELGADRESPLMEAVEVVY